MATGLVIRMHNGVVYTPNEGDVLEHLTGRQYHFRRPDEAFGTVPRKWNVCKGDIVSFTVSGDTATNVTLYKRKQDGVIRGMFPVQGPTTAVAGSSTGRCYVYAEFGGTLRLVGMTGGVAGLNL